MAADGARSSSGSSGNAGSLAIAASSTPGSVGWVRSPTVSTPMSRRVSYGTYSTTSRRKM